MEKSDEEEDEAAENVEAHDGVDDPFVDGLGGDAEEEYADGQLCCNHGPAVADVAEPPVLHVELDGEMYCGLWESYPHCHELVMFRESAHVSTGAEFHASDRTSGE